MQRLFRALVFDWDGTAVVDRREDAAPLVGLAATLERLGVWLVVVTGTNFGTIDRQFCSRLPADRRRRVLVCANRGSEVFGFDRCGRVIRRWQRIATPHEEETLTAIAEEVRDALVATTGLEIRIIYDRLNRRKIDLIPLPEWADPPKSRIGELLAAVEARLRGAGLAGGLAEAIRLTEQAARRHGMADARITSDVKHIEVGLTDKGDALAWVKRALLRPRGIALRDVLIAGDEFGPVAGFAGSDDRLRAGAGDAVVVSVGVEPNGVPPGVLHLGGGPARFRALLAEQVRLRRLAAQGRRRGRMTADDGRRTEDHGARSPLHPSAVILPPSEAPPADASWQLVEHNYQPALEHEVESRFTIGNGLLGVRGSIALPAPFSRPRTFVAGLFDAPPGPYPQAVLVSAPNWLRLRMSVDGAEVNVSPATAPARPRTLDLRRGVLLSTWYLHDAAGAVGRLRELRFVSLANRSLAVQLIQVEVERPVWVTLETVLEPVSESLVPVELGEKDPRDSGAEVTIWRTAHSARRLAIAATASLIGDGSPPHPPPPAPHIYQWVAIPEQRGICTRLVSIVRDAGADDPGTAALRTVERARRTGVRRLLSAHTRAWAERWAAGDVVIDGDEQAQQALRFAIYHLVSAANPDDERVSIGARALSGDAYLGHVFWDTEIFLLPFYTLTWPAAARALLMYRYHTLPAARAKAARLGYRGALYAWESADTGEDVTPPWVVAPDGDVIPIHCGVQEHHISAAVAYAVWQYWRATGDTRFFVDAGAEILLETARFWASRARLEDDGRYHIRGVIGPDEYHENVDDNAYTNGMARWNLERGLDAVRVLRSRWPERWMALSARLGVTASELELWREVAERLLVATDPSTGLIEQFAGFFALEPVDLAAYAGRTAPMDVLLGRARTQRSQVIKQADVVMLLALLWEQFPPAVRRANFDYYAPRCGHGSSLSPAIHALVAARLGDVDRAERYFHQAAAIDLDDTMGNAAGGVHIGALGGLWQAAVFGFAGCSLEPDGLRLDPHLPPSWHALRFALHWRGRRVRLAIERPIQGHGQGGSPSPVCQAPLTCTATLERGRPLTIHLADLSRRVTASKPWVCRWDEASQRWREVPP